MKNRSTIHVKYWPYRRSEFFPQIMLARDYPFQSSISTPEIFMEIQNLSAQFEHMSDVNGTL